MQERRIFFRSCGKNPSAAICTARLCAGSFCAPGGTAQSAPPLIPPRAGYNFPAKQTLTYAVDWRVFPAGTTVMHLQQDGNEERVSATGDTLGAINLIYRVSDRFQSSFNRRTGCSAGFAKQLQEGRRQVNTDLKFDYAHGKALLDEKNLVKGNSKHQEAPVGPCVTDLLSAIFYPASLTLTPGQSFRVPVADAMHTVAGDDEGGGARDGAHAAGNVSDDPRAANGGRRRGEGARQYLDLVHRRRAAHPRCRCARGSSGERSRSG